MADQNENLLIAALATALQPALNYHQAFKAAKAIAALIDAKLSTPPKDTDR